MSNVISEYPSVGPYTGVSRDETITYPGGARYRFLLYGAYNACGLIGSEKNGIAILDEELKNVVLDDHLKVDTGYFGPHVTQAREYDRLITAGWNTISEFVADHPRAREGYAL